MTGRGSDLDLESPPCCLPENGMEITPDLLTSQGDGEKQSLSTDEEVYMD